MKTLSSYQTDIIQLSEERNYHAVVISSTSEKGLDVKVILKSDFTDDEVMVGSYFSAQYDYAMCYCRVYSILNDLPFCDDMWLNFAEENNKGDEI